MDSLIFNKARVLLGVEYHGGPPSGWIARMSPEEQVVAHVMYSYGILGNGGFQYFCEGETCLYWCAIAAAYDAVAMPEAGACIREVLAMMPKRHRTSVDEWMADYEALERVTTNKERINAVLRRYYTACRNKAVERNLAAYIRANRRAHCGLEQAAAGAPKPKGQ